MAAKKMSKPDAETIHLLKDVLWVLFREGNEKHKALVDEYESDRAEGVEVAIKLGLKAGLIVRLPWRGPRQYRAAKNVREALTDAMERVVTSAVGSPEGPASSWERIDSDELGGES